MDDLNVPDDLSGEDEALAASAPVGVVVHLPSGEQVPVECVFVFRDPDGMFVWSATLPIALGSVPGQFSVECEVLPDNSSLIVAFALPDGIDVWGRS